MNAHQNAGNIRLELKARTINRLTCLSEAVIGRTKSGTPAQERAIQSFANLVDPTVAALDRISLLASVYRAESATQRAVALALLELQVAEVPPRREVSSWRHVELRACGTKKTFYINRLGQVRIGWTLKDSEPINPDLRAAVRENVTWYRNRDLTA